MCMCKSRASNACYVVSVCISVCVCVYVQIPKIQELFTCVQKSSTRLFLILQLGKDAEDATSCRNPSAKEPLITGLFCGKRPIKIKPPCATTFHPTACPIHMRMYINICTCIYLHIYNTCIYTYFGYICVCMHTCIHIQMRIHTYTYMFIYSHVTTLHVCKYR